MRAAGFFALLLTLGGIASVEGAAAARPRGRPGSAALRRLPRGVLAPSSDWGRNAGARLDRPVTARTDHPRPARAQLQLGPSYFDAHAARVRRDMLFFASTATGQNPPIRGDPPHAAPRSPITFVNPSLLQNHLEYQRERDRLLLFRGGKPSPGPGIAAGASLFGVATVGAAHAPRPLRVVFDRPLHLGPAILQGGGFGAGVGWRVP